MEIPVEPVQGWIIFGDRAIDLVHRRGSRGRPAGRANHDDGSQQRGKSEEGQFHREGIKQVPARQS